MSEDALRDLPVERFKESPEYFIDFSRHSTGYVSGDIKLIPVWKFKGTVDQAVNLNHYSNNPGARRGVMDRAFESVANGQCIKFKVKKYTGINKSAVLIKADMSG